MNIKNTVLILFVVLLNISAFPQTVKIGNNEWSPKNLDVTQFRNGKKLIFVNNKEEWIEACKQKQPAYCYFMDDSTNQEKFGLLYNIYAITDSSQLAPEGWHIATSDEWKEVINIFANKAGEKLKIKSYWKLEDSTNINQDVAEEFNIAKVAKGVIGTNESNFSAYPSGYRAWDGEFSKAGTDAYWWSSTKIYSSGNDTWLYFMSFNDSNLREYGYSSCWGLAVRCVENK